MYKAQGTRYKEQERHKAQGTRNKKDPSNKSQEGGKGHKQSKHLSLDFLLENFNLGPSLHLVPCTLYLSYYLWIHGSK